jgi:hypothetical protein
MLLCPSSAHVNANSGALPIDKRSKCRWFLVYCLFAVPGWAQSDNENKRISDVLVTFEGDDQNVSAADQFRQVGPGCGRGNLFFSKGP